MIQLYYGDGKGKTMAAVGASVRAAGRGRQVLFAQFMKGQESGELMVFSKMERVQVLRCGRDFPFFRDMTEAEKRELLQIHNGMLKEILTALQQGRTDFAVLDEITHACRFKLADTGLVEQILELAKGKETEVLLTGREPSRYLLEISDYITEMKGIRHPYLKGISARWGVEL